MAASGAGRALVVDDDERVAEVCRRVLEGLGLAVETAGSATEAWERMLAGRFDFVLTDIAMADSRAGVALAEEVKNRWPETDVVMMTGQPGLETAIPSLKTGVFDYLIKPFPNEQLESVARRLLGMRRLTKELEREQLLRSELEAAYAELQKVERVKVALLSRVIESHKPLWEARMLSVQLSAEGEPRPLVADAGFLEAAFKRLLLNAIHFNKKEGRIGVSTAYGPAEVAVAFSDTGVGVALEERERIFDGLYQAAEHMTREVGGLGVGLAVVRRIVEAHGGEVSVKSLPGEGSVFTVRLPAPGVVGLPAPRMQGETG